jgi:hypothetical protein
LLLIESISHFYQIKFVSDEERERERKKNFKPSIFAFKLLPEFFFSLAEYFKLEY